MFYFSILVSYIEIGKRYLRCKLEIKCRVTQQWFQMVVRMIKCTVNYQYWWNKTHIESFVSFWLFLRLCVFNFSFFSCFYFENESNFQCFLSIKSWQLPQFETQFETSFICFTFEKWSYWNLSSINYELTSNKTS